MTRPMRAKPRHPSTNESGPVCLEDVESDVSLRQGNQAPPQTRLGRQKLILNLPELHQQGGVGQPDGQEIVGPLRPRHHLPGTVLLRPPGGEADNWLGCCEPQIKTELTAWDEGESLLKAVCAHYMCLQFYFLHSTMYNVRLHHIISISSYVAYPLCHYYSIPSMVKKSVVFLHVV